MTRAASLLSYPIRWVVIQRYVGQVCFVSAVLNLVPAAVAALTWDLAASLAFLLVSVATWIIGVICSRADTEVGLQPNEALVVTCATFLYIAVTTTVPFAVYGLELSDAFFESVSAVTTTGLSTLPSVEDKPASFLFARAWVQWYGGLGIVIFSVALITQSDVAARNLVPPESDQSWSLGGVKLHARRVLAVYLCLTLAGFVVIALHGVGLWNALLVVLASVSTGGFSPHNASIRGLGDWPVQLTVSLVCLCGATPLFIYYRAFRNGWLTLIRDPEFQALLLASAIMSLAFCLLLRFSATSPSTLQSIVTGMNLGISAQTTTGFEPVEVAAQGDATKLALLWPMFVGGGIGSTAGGLKLVRFLILIQLLRTAIARVSLTRHAVVKPRLFGQPLGEKEIEESILLLLCYLILVCVSWLLFVLCGYAPLDSLFEVVSASGTVGLSSGVSSQELPTLLKLTLSADMLMGRLEIFAWLVVLSPKTWFGKQALES
jgi:trk system potassium uptake protein TrkH